MPASPFASVGAFARKHNPNVGLGPTGLACLSAPEKLRVQLYKTVKISRNLYRLCTKKIEIAITCQISNDWSILNSLVNNIRYTNFFMFGLGKFLPNIDELQILITVLHFWPPVIKNVEKLQRLFLVVWQTVRRSMQIYWKAKWLWYDSLTGGAVDVLLKLIFRQKRRGAVFELFCNCDRPWNKNLKSECSDFWDHRRVSDAVFKLIVSSEYVDALRR